MSNVKLDDFKNDLLELPVGEIMVVGADLDLIDKLNFSASRVQAIESTISTLSKINNDVTVSHDNLINNVIELHAKAVADHKNNVNSFVIDTLGENNYLTVIRLNAAWRVDFSLKKLLIWKNK